MIAALWILLKAARHRETYDGLDAPTRLVARIALGLLAVSAVLALCALWLLPAQSAEVARWEAVLSVETLTAPEEAHALGELAYHNTMASRAWLVVLMFWGALELAGAVAWREVRGG